MGVAEGAVGVAEGAVGLLRYYLIVGDFQV